MPRARSSTVTSSSRWRRVTSRSTAAPPRSRGKVDPKLVIGPVMTNGGLEATLARDGIGLIRTQVGDRYVWEELDKRKAQFGGEPSGHVIFREVTTTGDGILTALEVLTLMRSEHRSLADLASEIERWPQITKNVKAPRRREWKEVTRFSSAVRDAEPELGTPVRAAVRARVRQGARSSHHRGSARPRGRQAHRRVSRRRGDGGPGLTVCG